MKSSHQRFGSTLKKLPVTPGGESRTCGGCYGCTRPLMIEPSNQTTYYPGHIILEITNKCNLDCIMCERRLVKPDDYVLPEVWEASVEKFFPYAECVELSGLGEPTLEPLFPSRASTVAELEKPLYFPTNGAALTRSTVLDALRDTQETRVSLSFDAATEETYGRVRVDRRGRPGNWNKLMATISKFRDEKPNARLTTCFTAGAYNIDEFPEFVQLAIDLGFNDVSFKPVRCWSIGSEENSLRYRKDRTERALNKAFAIAHEHSFPLHVENPVYSESFENSGEISGFIHYLDVIPLDLLECLPTTTINTGFSSSAGSGGSNSNDTLSVISLAVSSPEFGVYRSPKQERKSKIVTSDVLQILTDGTVTSCGAKHVVGHVLTDSFEEIVNGSRYQSHLRARAEGQPLLSPYCRSCEKMF